MIEEAIEALLQPLAGYVPLLAFAVSFIGSLMVFLPIPYFPIISVLSLTSEPVSLIVSASSGASLAKLIIFLLSFWGGKRIGEERKKKMKPLIDISQKYGWLAAFIAAATPIPDDLVYIPLGILRYRPSYFFISTFLGKLVINALLVIGSRWTLSIVFYFIETTPSSYWLPSIIILTLVMLILLILLLKVDWNKVFSKFLRP